MHIRTNMDRSEIQFKLNKLVNIYRKQGTGYLVTFLWGKLKKKINNRFFYKGFYKDTILSPAQLRNAVKEVEAMPLKPVFSIIMPVYNVDEQWLVKAIDSVVNQLYPYWELCIADDASTKPHIKPVLERYAASDKRIKVAYRQQSGNISAASNTALELATGTFIGLLDNDDELSVNALYENAKIINSHPEADLIYSDEDKIDEKNAHADAWFKPDWSPEYLLSHMYTCHFSVYRTSLVKKAGGFRSGFDGAQDYDLALRISEQTDQVYHIPKILYHWRTIQSSTAHNPLAKSYAYEAGRKAVEQHIKRSRYDGETVFTDYYGVYKVNRHIMGNPLVSIVIPSAGKKASIGKGTVCLLENCISSILEKSTYKNIEIIIVDGADIEASVLKRCGAKGAAIVHCNEPFNFSMRINRGVNAASGAYIIMLNDDTEIITADWIEQLLGFAQQDQIGAVGAKLLTEKKQVQHAGIIMVDGSPGHIYYGIPDVGQGYFNALVSYKNYLAVTGACIMISRAKYDQVKGLDEDFPVNYNDVDFCLKLHEAGYRNVYSSHVVLYHYESISREKGYKPEELQKFVNKWSHYPPAQTDPYYNPNLVAYPSFLR